jgi:hypothetical protein
VVCRARGLPSNVQTLGKRIKHEEYSLDPLEESKNQRECKQAISWEGKDNIKCCICIDGLIQYSGLLSLRK